MCVSVNSNILLYNQTLSTLLIVTYSQTYTVVEILLVLCNTRKTYARSENQETFWKTIWNLTQGFSLGPNPSSTHARNWQYLNVYLVFAQLSYPFVYIEGDTSTVHHHQCCPASMCLHWHSCSKLPSHP